MLSAIVQLEHVSLIYHEPHAETLAVRDINFLMQPGEFLAIVGPSGCGKTSVLSLLAGLFPPSSGHVYVMEKEVNGPSQAIGYMLQHDHLLPWRTIEENVLLGLEVKHALNSSTKKHAHDLLNTYGLSEFKSHYPRQLSGGMKQKVALIRTLAFNPSLLLLDEPFSALDYQTRLTISEEVASIIRSEKKTAILVTHDIAEAISLADRILVFSGRPAHIKNEHIIHMSEGKSAVLRRNTPEFQDYFNIIWKELQTDE